MLIGLALRVALATQEPQLNYILAFKGGTVDEYARFVSHAILSPSPICVSTENLFQAVGPARAFVYTDQSVKFDPPIQPMFRVGNKGSIGYLSCKILPEPYLQTGQVQSLDEQLKDDDIIPTLRKKNAPVNVSGIDASLRLRNGLEALGFRTVIHPFFNDMWVKVHHPGSWSADLLDAIAASVGGTVVIEKGTPITYHIEPNVEEIRARALATLEYYNPERDSPAGVARKQLRYTMVKEASTDFLKRWIDASKKKDRVDLPKESWVKAMKSYRDLILREIINDGRRIGEKYTLEDCQAMPMYLGLDKDLEFSVVLDSPNGLLIFL